MISFIIPYRNRAEHLASSISHLNSLYKDCEIIISEQTDSKTFLHGQLLNIGFKYAKYDLIVFIDVDIRLIEQIKFKNIMDNVKKPYIPWNRTQQIDINGNILEETVNENRCFGYMFAFTKKQFIRSGGCSNLYVGWGGWDDEMFYRLRQKRINGKIYHIKHKKDKDIKTNIRSRNINILQTRASRSKMFDNYTHTIAKTSVKENNNIKHIMSENITVPDNFKYKHLL